MSGWTRREPTQNMIFLGDGEGDRRKVAGLLIDMQQNRLYPTKMDYSLVQKDGEVIILAGSASLGRQIGPDDVGKFLKAEFKGWGKSANGKFKECEVNVWEGDISPEMKAWPRYAEFHAGTKAAPAVRKGGASPERDDDRPDGSFPPAFEDDDSDLPF